MEKKGHLHQLAACAELARTGFACELRIVGDGPLREPLAQQATELGIGDRVHFTGAQPAAAVLDHYRWADCFWHTGVVDTEGDRDGLPNVIPEAMAHGVPVISCREGGATEAIQHGETGWTVEVRDIQGLAEAVRRLSSDLPLRRRLAGNARAWVETHFLSEKNTGLLATAFRTVCAGGQVPPRIS